MQIFVEYGDNGTIKNLSTIRTDRCAAAVFFGDPVDVNRLEGYTIAMKDGQAHASFDESKWQAYERKVNEEKARDMADDLAGEIALELVLKSATDEQALVMRPLYPEWQVGKAYKAGEYLQYDGKLYKVLQDHTSQADWTPQTAVSLYLDVADPSEPYPAYRAPSGAHDAYMKGQGVTFEGKRYTCLADGTVHDPAQLPSAWEVVEE